MPNKDKAKRICILTTAHPVFDRRVFHKQARTLADAGFDVSLIAQHDKDETVSGVKILSIPKTSNRILRKLFWGWFALKRAFRHDFDSYHFHDPELMPWMVLLKTLKMKPVIIDIHELYSDVLIRSSVIKRLPPRAQKIFSWIYLLAEKLMVAFFDRIIVTTEVAKKRYPTDKTFVISNYPRLDYLAGATAPERTGSTKIAIYAGSLDDFYGVQMLLRSLNYIDAKKDLKLKLIGKPLGGGEFIIPEDPDIKDRVELIDWLPHEQVAKHLLTADIALCCPPPLPMNLHMGSNKMYEYMAAGLPMVVSNFPLWIDFVEKNGYGLCADPLDPKDIAKEITYLLDHPQAAHRMGELGKKAAREKYNWELEGKKLVGIYFDIFK